jgi:uncharacterized protein YkwD
VLEEKIVGYTNKERQKRNLPPLRPSKALRFLARGHSENMCQTGSFRHESDSFPKGWQKFDRRLKRVGLAAGGENIGFQSTTNDPDKWARKMVDGWMKSPLHRKNILDGRFRYLGVGIRPCQNDVGYATQVFSPAHGSMP